MVCDVLVATVGALILVIGLSVVRYLIMKKIRKEKINGKNT